VPRRNAKRLKPRPERDFTTIKLKKAVRRMSPCGYRWQEGKVWKKDTDGLHIILSCGHPVVLPQRPDVLCIVHQGDVEIFDTAEEDEKEETEMSDTTAVSNKRIVPLTGKEKQVDKFTRAYRFQKDLAAQLDTDKQAFRKLANAQLDQEVGDVGSFEFHGSDGSTVSVGVTNLDAVGNRNKLDDKVKTAVAKLGGNIEDYTEVVETMTVKGPEWVGWLRAFLAANFTSKGNPIPDAFTETDKRIISDAGLEKLRTLRDTGEETEQTMARLILAAGSKAFSVEPK
jgi:hypothetical protein